MPQGLIIVIGLALSFALLNGIHDASNVVATMISSRAFSPRAALSLTAVTAFAGPFFFGVAVAQTIGDQVVQSKALNLEVVAACLMGAILWSLITWFFGIPSSSSHALIGGLIGAVLAGAGIQALKLDGLVVVLVALFTSPLLGFVGGFLITRLIYFLVSAASPRINAWFKRGQMLTALALAFSHGTNDASKTMGMITLSLVIGGSLGAFRVPLWVIAASAGAFAVGISFGGWRMIRTLGGGIYRIRPLHGFATQLTASIVILGASLFGLPISTTQIVSSAIVGVGSSESFAKVRWSVVGDIMTAWLITIPCSAALAAAVLWLLTSTTGLP
ncbi:MAG TPA: inorganic phosphate transporter [Anaerolineales bacterium]|jgi:PiT family inorganic phosphate transporter